MSKLAQFTVNHDATVIQAVQQIEANNSRTVVVLKEGKVVGVISEGDIMRAMLRGTNVYSPISEVIHSSFRYLNSRDYRKALEICQQLIVSLIPVVDEDFRLVDVITEGELLQRVQLRE